MYCTLSINRVQVQTLPTEQAAPVLTDSFSLGYDPYTHACVARPLTTVGRTSLSVIIIIIRRQQRHLPSYHLVLPSPPSSWLCSPRVCPWVSLGVASAPWGLLELLHILLVGLPRAQLLPLHRATKVNLLVAASLEIQLWSVPTVQPFPGHNTWHSRAHPFAFHAQSTPTHCPLFHLEAHNEVPWRSFLNHTTSHKSVRVILGHAAWCFHRWNCPATR